MAKYPGPIRFAMFTGPVSPLLGGGGSNDMPAKGVVACPRTWGVTEIKLHAGGKTSTSFDDRGHADIPEGRTSKGRFYFAPFEDVVTVTWKLKNPENAGTLVFELFVAGSGNPVWRRTLAADDARKERFEASWDGSFPSGEWTKPGDFPDCAVTVEHSPYMLKVTAQGNAEDGFVERWTYFDVLVEKIELFWGGVGRIPTGAPAGVTTHFERRTIQDERALVADLATKVGGGGTIDASARYVVALPSNQFPRTVEEQKNDSMFAGHRDQWGDGPRIPLLAKVWIRKADDSGVHGGDAAKALGKTKFLWDWEGEDEIANINAIHVNAAVKAFLTDTLDYKRNDGTCPPGSTNCHADHGGKRGGTTTVFPSTPAFPVTRCTRRVWAATSEAVLTGTDAATTGVVFQPSRMARDTYRVTVYLASEKAGGALALDVTDSGADLRRDHPELPHASTGWFEIARVVRARYVRKAPAVEAADLGMSTTEYRRAGLVLDWVPGPTDENEFQRDYEAYFQRILANNLHDESDAPAVDFKKPAADLVRAMADAFEGINQFTGNGPAGAAAAFTAHSWEVFHRKKKVDAIRSYVEKPRKINAPEKSYRSWRRRHPAPQDDSTWLLNFYDRLSRKKQEKIDRALAADLLARGTRNAHEYVDKLKTATVQGFKVIGGQRLNATREDGFICFHCVDSVQLRRSNGTFVEVPTSVGGLAPSDSTTTDRKKAINLMYIPHTVPVHRIGVPDVYDVSVSPIIKHEIGHNFYLVHAPAAPDAPREAGGNWPAFHDAADMLCLMNYDPRSDHLCGMCNVRLRGWAAKASSGPGFVDLSNTAAANKRP